MFYSYFIHRYATNLEPAHAGVTANLHRRRNTFLGEKNFHTSCLYSGHLRAIYKTPVTSSLRGVCLNPPPLPDLRCQISYHSVRICGLLDDLYHQHVPPVQRLPSECKSNISAHRRKRNLGNCHMALSFLRYPMSIKNPFAVTLLCS